MADARIERLLEETRAERAPASTPAELTPISYDGGPRRPVTANRQPMTLGQLVRAEVGAREEIRQRHQDNVRAWDRAARR